MKARQASARNGLNDLCEKAKAGDAEAFAQLYAQYAPKLYATAFYLLGRREDAEDTVMEAVADAFATIGKLRDAQAFGGWLYAILMNKIRRRRKGYWLDRETQLNEEIAAAGGGPDPERADLQRALGALSPLDREIVVLGVLGGYESAEIANILGLNANTVRSRRMRALAKLRAQLSEGGQAFETTK